jgi:hypothetical protein
MDVLHPCCCGLDVHTTTVVACLITTPAAGPDDKVTRALQVPAHWPVSQ